MSPSPNRYTALRELTEAFQADAVVDLTWQGCQTYDVESWSVKKFVREELDLPFLQIVTDYSEADTEQLKVRILSLIHILCNSFFNHPSSFSIISRAPVSIVPFVMSIFDVLRASFF